MSTGHAQRAHAPLSPSKSGMWLNCPAWIELAADAPESASGTAAKEGTRLHELAEHYLRAGTAPLETEDDAEFILPHINYCNEVIAFCDAPEFLIEKKVELIPGIVWGSCDAIIVDREAKQLWVIDLKTGRGHIVSPKYNTQLGTYALAAAKTLGLDLVNDGWRVTLAITQAAGDGFDGAEDWVCDIGWLCHDLLPRIEGAAAHYAAKHSGGVLVYEKHRQPIPGDHCLWCPAKASCPAQLRQAAEVFPLEITAERIAPAEVGPPAPALLTAAQLAQILAIAPQIEAYLKAVQAYAMQSPPPGWKLVEGRSLRKVTDEAAVAALLTEHAIDPYQQKLIPLGQMERALGKAKNLLEPFLEKPRGNPALVPETDPRPAFDPFLIADLSEEL